MKNTFSLAQGARSAAAAAAVLAFSLAPFAAFAAPTVSSSGSSNTSGGSHGSTAIAHLTVVTHVINDGTSAANASDWTMVVTNMTTHAVAATFAGSEQGVTTSLVPATYLVTEKNGPPGFALSSSQSCLAVLSAGENFTCTLVNRVDGNTAPFAQDFGVGTDMNVPVSVHLNVLTGSNAPLTYTVSAPLYGTLSGTAPDLTYTPNWMFNGTDSFTYSVNDGKVTSNTATVTLTVNLVQGNYHGSHGQVLGAATSTPGCVPTITKYMRPGYAQNDAAQVTALQTVLKKVVDPSLTVNGNYDDATTNAVKAFQTKYASDILSPWGISAPTGIVYITTIAALDKLECPTNAQGIPPLVIWTYSQGN